MHVDEYLRTASSARDIQRVFGTTDIDVESLLQAESAERDASVVRLRDDLGPPPRLRSVFSAPRLFASFGAFAALVTVAVFWLEGGGERLGIPTAYQTAHGEQRSWLLSDGSRLSLDSDTDVAVTFGGGERLVRIEHGRALFQVTHDATRRFRVVAGDTGVIAIGTSFDVDRTSTSTRVTVVEGRVAVFTGDAPRASALAALPPQALALAAGQQIRIDDHSSPANPSTVNVQQAVAWAQRQISFDQQPLGEVAEEFNRYSNLPIMVHSEQLRALRITGVFSAYDTDSFVSFISRLDGVKVERRADFVLVADAGKQ
jgi:transmembrane sensor